MDEIARAVRPVRRELFEAAAAKLTPNRSAAIVEKDFWVCWTLHRLFDVMKFTPHLLFKGGTSLSKAYHAIERFSEDVDLSLSRRDLGFEDEHGPEARDISRKEAARRVAQLTASCTDVIQTRLLGSLREDMLNAIGPGDWSLELDSQDPQTLLFAYPPVNRTLIPSPAIRPVVRLELGARSDDWPSETRTIRPYAAEAFPEAFKHTSQCRVNVLDANRTFWEKVTLLHAEFHRPLEKPLPAGLSRHYYDLFQLARCDIGEQALKCRDLLERVVKHKQLFFASAWAQYAKALTGDLHLVPNPERARPLALDYDRMKEMIYGDIPTWGLILEELRILEERIRTAARS